MEVNFQFYDEQALSVDLPSTVELIIETTDAAIKGQTASSSYKPATLENGINITVPPFINSGDKIVLDTRTLEYVKKINIQQTCSKHAANILHGLGGQTIKSKKERTLKRERKREKS